MSTLAELLIAALLVISGVFGLIGSYGLIKLPTPMMRLHAPTKATTIGVGAALFASMIHAGLIDGRLSLHELLIALFLFATAPVTGHLLAKVHIHRALTQADLPPPASGQTWASQSPPDPDPPQSARMPP